MEGTLEVNRPHPYETLAPGRYRLKVDVGGLQVVDREIVIRAGETTEERVRSLTRAQLDSSSVAA